ncbi:MAG: alanine racemase [Xanthobacteraceae bacterium]
MDTPALILDEPRMKKNVARLGAHLSSLGVVLRPHLKTVKSVDAAKVVLGTDFARATVSTLKEAEIFASTGVRDILYGVGLSPDKLGRVVRIRERGCDLTVVLDSMEQARAVGSAAREAGDPIPVLIEIDSDGHRSGLAPDDRDIVAIGRELTANGASLRGVVTHAGESYSVEGGAALAAFAEKERAAAVAAADMMRAAGLSCPVVSVGSTPTAHFAEALAGVTEVRAGVYAFFDLVMAGIGVCETSDIALSVLATVIGRQRERGWIMVDAGWMALSRDRGTATQRVDQFYGMVCDVDGKIYPDLVVKAVNQEHGIVALRPGSHAPLPDVPLGTKLRILPNHACATAAQFDAYTVLQEGASTLAHWPRFRGW